jgi:hypothetical protein
MFCVGDPIENALTLQVVGETAYTNPILSNSLWSPQAMVTM